MTGPNEMPADPFGEGGLGLGAAARLWRELIRVGTLDGEAGLARAVGALRRKELRALALRRLLAATYDLDLLEAAEPGDPRFAEPDPALLELAAERLLPLVNAADGMSEAELVEFVHRPVAAALAGIWEERA